MGEWRRKNISGRIINWDIKNTLVEENISQKFRLKSIDEEWNYFVQKIEQIDVMSKKHKKVCTTITYIGKKGTNRRMLLFSNVKKKLIDLRNRGTGKQLHNS